MNNLTGNTQNIADAASSILATGTGQNFGSAKPFWASQTIWSAIAVVGSSIGGAWLAWNTRDMAAFGAALTAMLGGINAVVGRLRATSPIK